MSVAFKKHLRAASYPHLRRSLDLSKPAETTAHTRTSSLFMNINLDTAYPFAPDSAEHQENFNNLLSLSDDDSHETFVVKRTPPWSPDPLEFSKKFPDFSQIFDQALTTPRLIKLFENFKTILQTDYFFKSITLHTYNKLTLILNQCETRSEQREALSVFEKLHSLLPGAARVDFSPPQLSDHKFLLSFYKKKKASVSYCVGFSIQIGQEIHCFFGKKSPFNWPNSCKEYEIFKNNFPVTLKLEKYIKVSYVLRRGF